MIKKIKAALKPKTSKFVDISTLIGEHNIPIKIKLMDIKYDPKGIYYSHKFAAESFVLISLIEMGKGNVYLTYTDNKNRYMANVPADFQIEVLKGTKASALIKKFNEYKIKNIRQLFYGVKPSVGSDPEMFIENEKGEIIPAFNFLGSKKAPNKAKNVINGNNNIYWDGFQAEFDTYPNGCLGWHVDSVYHGLQGLYNLAIKHNPKAVLSVKSTFEIPVKLLETSADEHVQFGCMPSQNIYGMKGLDINGRDINIRSAGGHIHIGCGKLQQKQIETVIKALDAIVGVACVSLFAGYDDPRRRTMYGLAGEYRTPAHGLEYRVLSNAWLIHPVLMNATFDLTRAAYAFAMGGLLEYWKADEKEIIEVINSCDVKGARKMLLKNETIFKELLRYKYDDKNMVDGAFRMFMEGIDEIVAEPKNFFKNWNLDGNWRTHSDGPNKNVIGAFKSINKKIKVA